MSPIDRLLVLAAATVVTALGAPSAQAAETLQRHVPVSGPVLVDGAAVWAEGRRDHGFELRATDASGGPPSVVQTFRRGETAYGHFRTSRAGRFLLRPRLFSAGPRLAAEVVGDDYYGSKVPEGPTYGVYTGLGASPITPTGEPCRAGDFYARSSGAAADAVAFAGNGCQQGAQQPTLIEYEGGREIRRDLPFPGTYRVSARHVAI